MAKERQVLHLRSNQVLSSGYPKIPQTNGLNYGEIAINYAAGVETLSIKNSDNEIVTFTPNTNVYVCNYSGVISDNVLEGIINSVIVYNYKDYEITFSDPYVGNYELTPFIDYIRTTFYDVCNLRVMLNVAKDNTTSGRRKKNTTFTVDTSAITTMINDSTAPISAKSTIVGFTKYTDYFSAGDSLGMNGILIDWDCNTKIMFIRYVYFDNMYRLDGTSLE